MQNSSQRGVNDSRTLVKFVWTSSEKKINTNRFDKGKVLSFESDKMFLGYEVVMAIKTKVGLNNGSRISKNDTENDTHLVFSDILM